MRYYYVNFTLNYEVKVVAEITVGHYQIVFFGMSYFHAVNYTTQGVVMKPPFFKEFDILDY